MKYLIALLVASCGTAPIIEEPKETPFTCPIYNPQFSDYVLPKNICSACLETIEICLGRRVVLSECIGTPYRLYAEVGKGWEVDRYVGMVNINTQVCTINGVISKVDGPPVRCDAYRGLLVFCDNLRG